MTFGFKIKSTRMLANAQYFSYFSNIRSARSIPRQDLYCFFILLRAEFNQSFQDYMPQDQGYSKLSFLLMKCSFFFL